MMANHMAGKEALISGWAAHFLPIAEFEDMYIDTVLSQSGYASDAMVYAWRGVDHFRYFPRLVAAQTQCLSETFLGGLEDDATRERELNKIRDYVSQNVARDFEIGQKAHQDHQADTIGEFEDLHHRKFYLFVQAEVEALEDGTDHARPDPEWLREIRIQGWAAHFVGKSDVFTFDAYKQFYARSVISNRRPEVLFARRALVAARSLPAMPPFGGLFDVCARPRDRLEALRAG